MQNLSHSYTLSPSADAASHAKSDSDELQPIASAPPVDCGGPGDRWSPETLRVAESHLEANERTID